jgi:hypothetical protein
MSPGWPAGSSPSCPSGSAEAAFRASTRILFDPEALGHTDAPERLKGFLRQRLRWDGDLFYLYVLKHRLALSPSILGWRNLAMLIWTGLFFQLGMPIVIIAYTVWIFWLYPAAYVLAVMVLVYLFYLVVTLLFFTLFIVFFRSDRSRTSAWPPCCRSCRFSSFSRGSGPAWPRSGKSWRPRTWTAPWPRGTC